MHDEPSSPGVPSGDQLPPLDLDLDVLLRQGFSAGDSVPDDRAREILEQDGGEWTQILLRDAGPDAAPPSTGGGGLLQGRYRMDGEIAKGGMGVVLRARDMTLSRDVAIKVLRSRHESSQVMRDRFLEEAQIGAQLQHPGIVPVHDIGMVGTRRPFFTMKLVHGRTLAALLAERSSPADQLPRLVGIFERICQTVAYAHARSVIHRDLKPSNVMLGAFGEVQVTDWGMAKVLAQGGIADEVRAVRSAPTATASSTVVDEAAVIETVRSGSDGSSASVAGSVFGTPSYMAPEQARGETDAVNERADVFALGAILTEMLTGRPPFRGTREVALAQARLGDVEDAVGELHGCGADPDLVDLAVACLAPDAGARPATGQVVADAVTRHVGKVAERAQAAVLAAARSEARASAERRSRKMATALFALVLVAVFAGLSTWGWIEHEGRVREERTAEAVDRALVEGRTAWQAAAAAGEADVPAWLSVAAVARRATDLAVAGPADAATQARARTFAEEVASAVTAAQQRGADAQADDRLRARLEELRALPMGGLDWQRADREYIALFAGLGLDIERGELPDLAERVRSHRLAMDLVSGLDDWAMARQNATSDAKTKARIVEVARLADPDPVRSGLRALLVTPDAEAAKRAAASIDLVLAPPSTIWLLERALRIAGERQLAWELLVRGQACHPGDFWLAQRLGQDCSATGDAAGAVRYNSAALAVRPDSLLAGVRLSADLHHSGRTLESIAVLRQLRVHHPTDPNVVHNLRAAFLSVGSPQDALPLAEQEVSLDPTSSASLTLAKLLRRLGRHDEARVQFELAATKDPRDLKPLLSLGAMLCDDLKQFEAARDVFLRALAVDPASSDALCNLGLVFDHLGRADEALAYWRTAADSRGGNARALERVAFAEANAGRHSAARDAAQRAVALEPGRWRAWYYLGEALAALGDRPAALEAWHRAVAVKADLGVVWFRLGQEMVEQPETLAEAIAAFQRAVAIQSDSAEWQVEQGRALLRAGRLDEAADAAEAAVGLLPDDADALKLKAEVAARRNR